MAYTDALSFSIGVLVVVGVVLYWVFKTNNNYEWLKYFVCIAALSLLLFVPQSFVNLNSECTPVLNSTIESSGGGYFNTTYEYVDYCITPSTNLPQNFYLAYRLLYYIIFLVMILTAIYKLLKWLGYDVLLGQYVRRLGIDANRIKRKR